jgi:homoserine dehydrogenase
MPTGIAATVVPSAVSSDGPFGRTDGVTNRIEIDALPLGTVGMAGPGAGGAATSSAVLGDLLAVARGLSSTWAGLAPAARSATAAASPFDGERRWLAFVPIADLAPGSDSRDPADVTKLALPTGVAIQTAALDLEAARALIVPLLRGRADATLYPVDDLK